MFGTSNRVSPRHCRLLVGLVLIVIGGKATVAQEKEKPRPERKKPYQVAVVIFDGVELLDFAGPAEVFIVADNGRAFQVYTVAKSTKTIRTMGGIRVEPDHSFKDSPHADIIVVPGGNVSAAGPEMTTWLRTRSKKAEVVMSVCFGAFALARAGLLDGVSATTHSWGIAGLRSAAPKCKVVQGKRVVDAGKVITTGGVSAGIDGALHVVERLLGAEAARWTAEEWMEYKRPQPPAKSP